ncbi:DUF885 family protein [Pseudoalteromonas sp. NBT06-2]|uniref:DUF885 family protein n=1 Tax=Pseudoalteromonas sp. NBT06-2 TaxID=2025950 RepID=UPI002074C9C0|nr:DUF885 family protein [Pseudoalteromonas sp. NBT06-2]
MNKSALALALASVITLSACNITEQVAEPSVSQEQVQFSDFSKNFIEKLWKNNPEWSLWAGYGKYDDILTVPNKQNRQKDLAITQTQLSALQKFDIDTLNPNQKTDYYLIENLLKENIWNLTKFKSWQWNPSSYNVAGGFAKIINGRFKSDKIKFEKVLRRLVNVPDYYAAAQNNIENPTIEYTQLAISN